MLTHSEVVSYLLAHHLIDARSIVEGDLVVQNASRRNHNFKVQCEFAPSYLLKQGIDAERMMTLEHEASVYRLLDAHPQRDELRPYLARFYAYDPEQHLLVLELVPNAESLREYTLRRGRFSKAQATRLGQALATLHRATFIQQENDPSSTNLYQPPWILSIHLPHLRIFQDVSSANLQLVKIVQQFGEFAEVLDGLRTSWRQQALIHFDIKWDNCLVSRNAASPRKPMLKIIDWELAGLGDPCWDVGSVFSDYLAFWLLSLPVLADAPPEHYMQLTRYPLERMQPALNAFWQSYRRTMALATPESQEWLLRAVRYASARLLQSAFEQSQMSLQLTSNTICMLQLSFNMMQRPHEAIVYLLGIKL